LKDIPLGNLGSQNGPTFEGVSAGDEESLECGMKGIRP
jgi:hypothetical protein